MACVVFYPFLLGLFHLPHPFSYFYCFSSFFLLSTCFQLSYFVPFRYLLSRFLIILFCFVCCTFPITILFLDVYILKAPFSFLPACPLFPFEEQSFIIPKRTNSCLNQILYLRLFSFCVFLFRSQMVPTNFRYGTTFAYPHCFSTPFPLIQYFECHIFRRYQTNYSHSRHKSTKLTTTRRK